MYVLNIFSAFTVRDVIASSTDYTLVTNTPAMIANPSGQITLSATTDSVEEGVEVFEISITPDMQYAVGTPSTATVFITNAVVVVPPPPSPIPTGKLLNVRHK